MKSNKKGDHLRMRREIYGRVLRAFREWHSDWKNYTVRGPRAKLHYHITQYTLMTVYYSIIYSRSFSDKYMFQEYAIL